MIEPNERPEIPRSEPEIIPPGRGRVHSRRVPADWFVGGEQETQRIFVTRLGPFSGIAMIFVACLVAGVVLAIVLGTLLIAIPVIVLLVAAAVISRSWRTRLRR
jgi:hypothetical protein